MIDQTPLCTLALKYGADKCPQISHNYTPYYYEMFKNRQYSIRKVLEIGIGGNVQRNFINTDKSFNENYHLANIPAPFKGYVQGASLKMWRDFFPNAQIYGADIVPEAMFTDERIITFYCDERKEADIRNLIATIGSDIDIVIDDAWHYPPAQAFLARTLLPLLDKGVQYFIEDCKRIGYLIRSFPEYDCFAPALIPNENPLCGDGFVVIKHQ